MATLSITKTYMDATLLTEAQLDAFCDSIQTFFNVTKINDDNIVTKGITANDKLVGASIQSAQLAVALVTSAKFAPGAVTASKVDAGASTLAKFSDGAVTAGKYEAATPLDETLVAASVLDDDATTSAGDSASASGKTFTLGITASEARPSLSGISGSSDITTTNQGFFVTYNVTAGSNPSFQVAFSRTSGARLAYAATGPNTMSAVKWEIPTLGAQLSAAQTPGAYDASFNVRGSVVNGVPGGLASASSGSTVKGLGFVHEL